MITNWYEIFSDEVGKMSDQGQDLPLSDQERGQLLEWRSEYEEGKMLAQGQVTRNAPSGFPSFLAWLTQAKKVGESEKIAVRYNGSATPIDDLNREFWAHTSPSTMFPPPFLCSTIREREENLLRNWQEWAKETGVEESVLDLTDTILAMITMLITRGHVMIKTERFTPLIKQLTDAWKPRLDLSFNQEQNGQQYSKTFRLFNQHSQVYKNGGFKAPTLLKSWMRMRGRPVSYTHLTLPTKA